MPCCDAGAAVSSTVSWSPSGSSSLLSTGMSTAEPWFVVARIVPCRGRPVDGRRDGHRVGTGAREAVGVGDLVLHADHADERRRRCDPDHAGAHSARLPVAAHDAWVRRRAAACRSTRRGRRRSPRRRYRGSASPWVKVRSSSMATGARFVRLDDLDGHGRRARLPLLVLDRVLERDERRARFGRGVPDRLVDLLRGAARRWRRGHALDLERCPCSRPRRSRARRWSLLSPRTTVVRSSSGDRRLVDDR